jgi:hypothetical protein
MSNEQLTMKNGDMGKGGCRERRNKNGELEVRSGDMSKGDVWDWIHIEMGNGE